jgi:cytochrome c-type biogenesis protein CcmF
MTNLGPVLLAISTFAALISIVLLVLGHLSGPKQGEGMTNAGYFATFAVFGTTTASVLLLLVALFQKNLSFLYVIENRSTDVSGLAWLYNISSLWAGREGSLLFWAWLLSAFVAYMAWKRISVTDALSNVGLAVLNFVQIFFLVALFFETNNPFKAAVVLADGSVQVAGGIIGNISTMAMSPLLQHWAMILHPPTLFIGYAGLAIPFAFALAAVFLGDSSKKWVDIVGRVTVFSWFSLGIGIGLGAIWAYVVLGWGGYWAWDPVENASLLPWLTGVGLLHSFTVYRRRGGLKKWAVMMSAVTFMLVLLGTFITRSGVIQSVHSFGEDPLSLWWFLGMMVLSVAVPAIALVVRSEKFKDGNQFESLISKEASYYLTNILMLFAALLVALLTLSPALRGPTFSAPTFDLLARPVGIFYVLLMALCPILSWGVTDSETFWKRAKWPLGGAAVIGAGLLAIWALFMLPNYTPSEKGLPGLAAIQAPLDHIESFVGLLVAALAIALPIYLFWDGSRKRAKTRGESPVVSFFNILFKARTQSGGYLTHLGVGIVLIGLIGSTMYVKSQVVTLQETPGSKATVGGYDVVYQGFDEQTLSNKDVVQTVKVDLVQNGRVIANLEPSVVQMANRSEKQSTRFNAAVDVGLLRDVFVAFQGAETAGLEFEVKINPMISWAWVGFVIMILGTGIAMWPKRELAPAPTPAPVPSKKKK